MFSYFQPLNVILFHVFVSVDVLKSLNCHFNRLAEEYQQISESARTNIDEYLGHPVNQYRLVKRLASEWSEMEDLVMEDVTPGK